MSVLTKNFQSPNQKYFKTKLCCGSNNAKKRVNECECENDYRPLSKLYVAYAVVYNRMNNSKKTDYYYNQIIEIAESKKDSMTLIPILINTSTNFLQKKTALNGGFIA